MRGLGKIIRKVWAIEVRGFVFRVPTENMENESGHRT